MREESGPNILVVEDSPDDERLTVRALNGHLPRPNLTVMRDGRSAIECIQGTLGSSGESSEDIPDLVVLDLKLPVASGFDVLKVIRSCASTRLVPVVVFSSSDEPRDVDEAYSLGANTYVQKPVDLDEYSDRLRRMTRYWFNVALLPGQTS